MPLLQTLPVIAYPTIDPVLIELGPFAIRWYALAYIAGLLLGWRYVVSRARAPGAAMTPTEADDFLLWATLGVILGGRLGYVAFYQPMHFVAHPWQILAVWQGGMSFHGGLLGVAVALVVYARRRRLNLLGISDLVSCAAPIGLFFGRLANFINGELYGRTSELPWAMAFPAGGPLPRHPSQLYEATLEGLVPFILLGWIWRFPSVRARRGFVTGIFLIGYAIARVLTELFRQPDAHIGFLLGGVTMGQLLSLPLVAVGLYFMVRARPSGESEA